MTTRDVLIAARAKIADIDRWTQRAEARDADGFMVGATSVDACFWCAIGSITAITKEIWWAPGLTALNRATDGDVVTLNDRTDIPRSEVHAAVLAAFDRAIAAEPV